MPKSINALTFCIINFRDGKSSRCKKKKKIIPNPFKYRWFTFSYDIRIHDFSMNIFNLPWCSWKQKTTIFSGNSATVIKAISMQFYQQIFLKAIMIKSFWLLQSFVQNDISLHVPVNDGKFCLKHAHNENELIFLRKTLIKLIFQHLIRLNFFLVNRIFCRRGKSFIEALT